jgi:hypothetical protein
VLSGDPTRQDPFGLNVAMTILEGDIAFRS